MKVEILLASYKQLGDTVLLEPTLSSFAKKQSVGLIVRPGFEDLVDLMGPGICQVHPLPQIRAERVICADAGSRCAARACLVRAKRREVVIEGEKQIRFLHRAFRFRFHKHPCQNQYRAEWLWRICHPDLPASHFRPPSLAPPPGNWAPAAKWMEGLEGNAFVICHVSSAWRRKCWPAECWAEWINTSNALKNRLLLLTAGPAAWEQALAKEIAAALKRPACHFCGMLSFREFAWLLAHASTTVTLDGAAGHLSRAFGVPTLTLFGETCPQQWHPGCQPHRWVRPESENIRNLRPEIVERAFLSLTDIHGKIL